jgi:hypothetical protein
LTDYSVMQMATSGERGRVIVQRDSSLPVEPPLPVIGHSVGDVKHRRSPSAPNANATIPLNGGTTIRHPPFAKMLGDEDLDLPHHSSACHADQATGLHKPGG